MNSDTGIIALFAVFIVLAISSIFWVPALASGDRAQQVVENMGWTQVHVDDESFAFGPLSGCGQHDNVQFHVSGYINGQRRVAHVCATFPFGGYTVRG